MPSAPKETTTKVEPWDGAKPFLTDIYQQYNDLIKSGSPAQWSGSTVADQSAATVAGQQGVYDYASNPWNTAGIWSGQDAVKNVTNGSAFGNTAANTLTAGTRYTNPGIAKTQSVINGINSNYVNPATGMASGGGNYSNSALGLQQA